MNNSHNYSVFRIIQKSLLVLICAFILVSNFEVTKLLALTHIDNKENIYGEYYDKEYSTNIQVNVSQETMKSNGMGNHIHFNLEDESNNNLDDNDTKISDSSFIYEYYIDEYTTVYESYDNNDYKKIEVSNEPVNYTDNNGEYSPIDTTIEPSNLDEFESSKEAETVADLLNNEIGIEIGNKNKYNNMKEVTYDALEHYYKEGLNIVAESDNNTYLIIKQRLDLDRYDKAINVLDKLDINGFPFDNPYYSGVLK